jgi:myo-inositol catabolism protein IolC
MTLGYNKPLYILPFDHRATFQRGMFGWKGSLTLEQTAQITAAKMVIYDALKAAVTAGVPKDRAGILVDEQFGAAILRQATRDGFITSAPAEKSGQDEFDFEYGDEFATHIEVFDLTFCKVLVRYNPEGDQALNRRQAARLRRLSEYLHTHNRKYMFELLIPATPDQLHQVGENRRRYDLERRPSLMVQAIRELQEAGVEPDLWKIEGLDRREDCLQVAETARRGGRDEVGCIVLGRGEDESHVHEWLATAAGVPGFVGFAVGRTTFWEPLMALKDQQISREAALAEIAQRYRQWVNVFEGVRVA